MFPQLTFITAFVKSSIRFMGLNDRCFVFCSWDFWWTAPMKIFCFFLWRDFRQRHELPHDFSRFTYANLRTHTGFYMWCFSSPSSSRCVWIGVKAQRSPAVQSLFGFGAARLSRSSRLCWIDFHIALLKCSCANFTVSYNGSCVTILFLFYVSVF